MVVVTTEAGQTSPKREYPAGVIRLSMHTVYGSPTEEDPPHMPPPKGKQVRTSTFVDANLMHDWVTGRSCTGILHMINQTPIQWFTKRQKQI